MASPETSSSRLPIDRRWLWAARIAALVTVITALVYMVASPHPVWVVPCWEKDSLPLGVFLLILVSPYALSLKGLWGRKLKQGLAWAGIAGVFWGAVFMFVVMAAFAPPRHIADGLLALFVAATQVTLLVSAIKTFRSLEREEGQRRIIRNRVLLFVPYVPVVLIGFFFLPPRCAADEAGARRLKPEP